MGLSTTTYFFHFKHCFLLIFLNRFISICFIFSLEFYLNFSHFVVCHFISYVFKCVYIVFVLFQFKLN